MDRSEVGIAEIYALAHPKTGEVRYIGKAKSSANRLKSHLRDMKRRDTPLYRWLRKLSRDGLVPALSVLNSGPEETWRERKKAAIVSARSTFVRLLNVADGGDQPFCSAAVRAENGRTVAKRRSSTPQKKRIYELKREIGQALRRGKVGENVIAKTAYRRPQGASLIRGMGGL